MCYKIGIVEKQELCCPYFLAWEQLDKKTRKYIEENAEDGNPALLK